MGVLKVLQGKKTWIGAACLALVGAVGYVTGSMSGTAAAMLISLALTAFGLGDKADRYSKAIVAELQEAKTVQQAIAAGKKVDVASEVVKASAIAISAESGDRG
jgi:hypothetical protein